MNPAPAPPWHGMILQDIGGGRREGKGGGWRDKQSSAISEPPFPPPGRRAALSKTERGIRDPYSPPFPSPNLRNCLHFPAFSKGGEKIGNGGGFSLVANMGWERKVKQKRCLNGMRKYALIFKKKHRYQLCDLDGGDGGGQKYFFSKNICFASYSFLLSTKHFRALHP